MKTSTQFASPRQSRHTQVEDAPLDLSFADIVYDNQTDAFFGRLRDPRWAEKFKWAIISLWQSNGIGTDEAVWWLGQAGFIETDIHPEQAEAILQGYIWYERHRAETVSVLAQGARS